MSRPCRIRQAKGELHRARVQELHRARAQVSHPRRSESVKLRGNSTGHARRCRLRGVPNKAFACVAGVKSEVLLDKYKVHALRWCFISVFVAAYVLSFCLCQDTTPLRSDDHHCSSSPAQLQHLAQPRPASPAQSNPTQPAQPSTAPPIRCSTLTTLFVRSYE